MSYPLHPDVVVFWGTLLRVPGWLLLLPVALASALLLRAARRRL